MSEKLQFIGASLRPNRLPKYVMWASLFVSAAGVGLATIFKDPSLGLRGGVLGIAMSFAILFSGRSTSNTALTTSLVNVDKIVGADPVLSGDQLTSVSKKLQLLEEKHLQLRGALASLLDWNDLEKRYISISSVVSTLVAGFGDLIALVSIRLIEHIVDLAEVSDCILNSAASCQFT